MRLSVSVPVLSVAITVTDPSASTAESLRTTARCRAIRSTPIARATVSTAGSPSGTAATASATAKMTIAGVRPRPSAEMPNDTERHSEQQDPARDLLAEAVDTPLERRLDGLDVAKHRGQTTHRARTPCSRDGEIRLSADQKRSAERFVAVTLIDWYGFPGEHGFVKHRATAVHQRAIRRNPVAGLQADHVCRYQRVGREVDEATIPEHPRTRPGQRLQATERGLRALFLIKPQCCVE